MNKITLLKIALLSSFFSFAQNIDTTKYQKVAPGDTIRNYYNPNNSNYNSQGDTIKDYYPSQGNQQPNQNQPNNYKPDKSYPYRNQRGRGNTNTVQKKQNNMPPSPLMDKLYFGAYVYLTAYGTPYGSITYYELSPHVGYKVTDKFSAGLQLLYNNAIESGGGYKPTSYSVIGGGAFARFLITRFLFIQVEYDALAVPSNYLNNIIIKRSVSDEKMAGLGFKRDFGNKFGYFIMLSYDFEPTTNSPYYYDPLVYRLGFSYNW